MWWCRAELLARWLRETSPRRSVGDDKRGGLGGPSMITAIAGRADNAPGQVTAPTLTAVRAEEHVVPAAAVLPGACAPFQRLGLDLPREQPGEERGRSTGMWCGDFRTRVDVEIFSRQAMWGFPHARPGGSHGP
jgi:hypothetical protein